jgi:hypothetical protein
VRPVCNLRLLREQDDLLVARQSVQQLQDLYRAPAIGLHGHIVEEERARRSLNDKVLCKREAKQQVHALGGAV